MSLECHVKKNLYKWAIYSVAWLIAGIAFSYGILLIWFLFTWIVLGYGDSGPDWINKVNNGILITGVLAGFILGQLWFFKENHS
jgi:hypothetical protein